ncbi:MAG: hypothetical protein ACREAC_30240, partial [Blastocatellia bacterium]
DLFASCFWELEFSLLRALFGALGARDLDFLFAELGSLWTVKSHVLTIGEPPGAGVRFSKRTELTWPDEYGVMSPASENNLFTVRTRREKAGKIADLQ